MMIRARWITSSPAGVMAAMLLPFRKKSWVPSSVSSSFSCLLIPGWLVKTRFAAAVILSPQSAIAST